MGTLKTPAAEVDINNPSAVKVVTDATGRALYFSRATIPHDRDGVRPRYYKHLGFYGYRKDALDKFVRWPESSLERSERLEQLRFLENGVPIYVAETPFDTVGVDTEEDVRRVEGILRNASWADASLVHAVGTRTRNVRATRSVRFGPGFGGGYSLGDRGMRVE